MIYIIEGVDGTGKTTLAERLSKMTGAPIIHRDKPVTDEEKAAMMDMYVECIANNEDAIFDRAWYSEMVYGPIKRDKSYITQEQMWSLERMMSSAVIIYCTGDPDEIWSRCKKRGEDYVHGYGEFIHLFHLYERLMLKAPHYIPVLRYDVN